MMDPRTRDLYEIWKLDYEIMKHNLYELDQCFQLNESFYANYIRTYVFLNFFSQNLNKNLKKKIEKTNN